MGRRRDALLARLAGRGAAHDGGRRALPRPVVAAGLGWLVLMTIWGFGRSAAPERAGSFLAVGLVVGTLAAVLTARR
jgi:hypothetical protein